MNGNLGMADDLEPMERVRYPWRHPQTGRWFGPALGGAGVVLGLSAATALTRYLTTLFFEVQATDPLTFGIVAVLLLAVACLACYIPARRAGRMAAATALRAD